MEPALDRDSLLAHATFVRAVAARLVDNQSDVDDLVQETWLAALATPSHATRPRAWWRGLVKNLARFGWRSRLRRETRERLAASAERLPPAADVVAEFEMHRKIVDAVLALAEPYRTTILLCYYRELSADEVARHEEVPVETVRT